MTDPIYKKTELANQIKKVPKHTHRAYSFGHVGQPCLGIFDL